MPSAEEIRALLDEGHSFETAARELGISPGLAFMVATGVPADGSDGLSPEELEVKKIRATSTQPLSNPPAFNPTVRAGIAEWVAQRARQELNPPAG